MPAVYLIKKLESVEQTFNELTRRMGDPDVATDHGEFQRIAKVRASLEETVLTYETFRKAEQDYKESQEILKESNDPELMEMAALEVEELSAKLSELEAKLQILYCPKILTMIKTSCWKSAQVRVAMRLGSGLAIWCGYIRAMPSVKAGE